MVGQDSFGPGPRQWLPGSSLWSLHRDPIAYMAGLQERYGDLVHWRIGPQDVVMVARSDLARDVLVTHHRSFKKGPGFERAQIVLGRGLLTSEGDLHLRHRRMIQPAFHRRSVAAYGDIMVTEAARLRDGWQAGATVDVADEMMRVTLAIVSSALFGHSVEDEAATIGEAVTRVGGFFDYLVIALLPLLLRTPLPAVRRFKRGCAELDAATLRVIASRRDGTVAPDGDLLSILLAARDVEGDQAGLTDAEVRDEVVTLITAGHETTANALNWLWYLLAQHPEVERRMHEEIDSVLGGRLPTAEDMRAVALRGDGAAGGHAALPAGLGNRATGSARSGDRRLPDPRGRRGPDADIHHEPRRALLPRSAAFRPRALRARGGRGPAAACLPALRRRATAVHRERVRAARGRPDRERACTALAATPRSRTGRDGPADRHPPPEGRAADDRRAPGRMSAGDDPGPGLAEALALWATLGVLCVLAWITYARLPARDFYNVSGTGFRAGASRVLVLLGWPISLIAIALLAVAVDRLLADDTLGRGARRLVVATAVVSLLLCLTIVWPGVINQDNLDAKPSNALAALGVGLALVLTLWGLARRGVGRRPRHVVGDRAAVALIALLLVAGIPWLFAHVGIYVGDVPGLRAIFMSKKIIPEAGHPHLHAVHLGNHEGLDGILLAATALALSRQLGLHATHAPALVPCRLSRAGSVLRPGRLHPGRLA